MNTLMLDFAILERRQFGLQGKYGGPRLCPATLLCRHEYEGIALPGNPSAGVDSACWMSSEGVRHIFSRLAGVGLRMREL